MKLLHLSLIYLALVSLPLHAERADREKPMRLRANASQVDDRNKTRTLDGNVSISQGSLLIRADKVIVTLEADGYERAVAIGGEGGLARMQQKREGRNEIMYAEAERIEYTARDEKAKLVRRAWISVSKGEEACADQIEYNGLSETYQGVRLNDKKDNQIDIVIPGKSNAQSSASSAASVALPCERKR